MTLSADEFIRRFLLHVLAGGFHRIRHYGLLANGCHKASIALSRTLLGQPSPVLPSTDDGGTNVIDDKPRFVCAHCGAAMLIVQIFTTRTHLAVMTELVLRSLNTHWLAVDDCRWASTWPNDAETPCKQVLTSPQELCPPLALAASPACETRSASAPNPAPAEREPLSP
jgi:hypothetical protein